MISVELRKNNKVQRILDISQTLPTRLNEIKGDIKVRNEIIRETIHNCIDASANRIDIEIKYIDNNYVNIFMSCYGDNLAPFKDIESIINSLLVVDVSEKRNISDKIGGKGRGAKILLSCKKLTIESIIEKKINSIEIEDPDKQIEELSNGNQKNFIVNVLKDNYITDNKSKKILYVIEGVHTQNIKYFQHESIVKYIKFFTILSGIKNSKKIDSNLVVNVKGLVEKGKSKSDYQIKDNSESIKVENVFDEVKKYGIANNLEFSCIKCSNGTIKCINKDLENEDLLEDRLNKQAIKELKDFFKENECYIFRTTNQKLKEQMKICKDDNDTIYFGVRAASEGVMINETLDNISKKNAYPSGGNLFAQYFGYIYSSEISPTGDRNRIQDDTKYQEFIQDFSDNIMPLINDVLNLRKREGAPTIYKPKLVKILEKKEKEEKNLIQGLYAELCFILQNKNMIKNWVAHQKNKNQRKPHDFETRQGFYEIKSKQENKNNNLDNLIDISSVDQLDDEMNGKLRIYYLKSNAASSKSGMNILDIIKKVSELIDSTQLDNLFEGVGEYLSIKDFKKLYKKYEQDMLDASDEVKDNIKLDRFTVKDYIEYIVNKEFPCLKQKTLNDSCAKLNDTGYKLDLNLVDKKLGITPKREKFDL